MGKLTQIMQKPIPLSGVSNVQCAVTSFALVKVEMLGAARSQGYGWTVWGFCWSCIIEFQ